MGSFSLVHWAIVGIAAIFLFGGGRIARTMGDLGQGLKAFRKGLAEDDPAGNPLLPSSADD